MKNLLMIGLLCLTFFAGQETFAQETTKSGPTLAETFDFLKGKINGSKATRQWRGQAVSAIQHQLTYTYRIKSASDDEILLEEKLFLQSSGIPSSSGPYERTQEDCSTQFSILLNEIVPASIKVTESEGLFIVGMKPAVNKKIEVARSCQSTTLYKGKTGLTEVDSFGIFFSDKETAEKVAKALIHAVKLNGGRDEIF